MGAVGGLKWGGKVILVCDGTSVEEVQAADEDGTVLKCFTNVGFCPRLWTETVS